MERSQEDGAISVEFAQELLRALYRLDKPIDELNAVCAELPDGDLKARFIDGLSEVMHLVLCDLMVPIYRRRPGLGRASEPGAWLADTGVSDTQ